MTLAPERCDSITTLAGVLYSCAEPLTGEDGQPHSGYHHDETGLVRWDNTGLAWAVV